MSQVQAYDIASLQKKKIRTHEVIITIKFNVKFTTSTYLQLVSSKIK